MLSLQLLSLVLPLALAAHKDAGVHRRAASGIKRSSSYSLTEDCSGSDFFDCFDFDTTSSNGGIANFVDSATAYSQDMVAVKNGYAHIRVHPVANSDGTIDAIKLTTKKQYSEGLYLWDVERSPQTCAVWPAIWSTGDNWPAGGELDLVEYVNRQSYSSSSVHTSAGCYAGSTGYSGTQMLSGSEGLNCDAEENSAQGCGFRDANNNTAGIGANYHKDGVYALLWDSDGIKTWFFPRADIPSDITSKNPDPSGWDTPTMFIDASSCDPSTYFTAQTWIINIQLCGTWAGSASVWGADNSYAGQSGSCAADTGYSSCSEYALANAADLKHAYWKVASFRIYNK